VGLRLVGEQDDLIYDAALDRVLITVGGSVADLDRLDGATLVADLDVADLEPGTDAATVSIDLPAGVTLVAASPDAVSITVSAPPTPSPTAAETPSPTPSATPSPGG
jgi:YbbR domain-containing protein